MDNGEVPALLAHIFAGYQGSSGAEAAIVCLCCCISECIDSFKCFVSINDAFFFVVLQWCCKPNFVLKRNAFEDFFKNKTHSCF